METTCIAPPPPQTRQEEIIQLYRQVFPAAARYISRRGGSQVKAQDVFQEALLLFYEKKSHREATGPDDAKAYLMGIVKHLWARSLQKENRLLLDPLSGQEVTLTEVQEPEPVQARLLAYLESAGRKCLDLLSAFYYEGAPLQQIASRFGFSGVRSATAQKYKCLEKVRRTVREKALTYDDFLE